MNFSGSIWPLISAISVGIFRQPASILVTIWATELFFDSLTTSAPSYLLTDTILILGIIGNVSGVGFPQTGDTILLCKRSPLIKTQATAPASVAFVARSAKEAKSPTYNISASTPSSPGAAAIDAVMHG